MGEVIEMSFSENLRVLRKKEEMSQEQLAEKLNVSRQAVSKWESEQGYPEMETLIQISNLFHCSIDQLIKETLVETSLEEINFKAMYDQFYQKFSLRCTIGIGLILLGVSVFLLLAIFFPDGSKTEFIPTVVFLLFVLSGVISFIIAGTQMDAFKKKNYDVPFDLYTMQEKDRFNKTFGFAIAFGVASILLGVIIQVLLDGLLFEEIANFVFMLFISIGVCVFVYFGTQKSKFEEIEKHSEEKQKEAKKEIVIGTFCGIIMIIAIIIYFLWSFLTNDWHISWLVFPIGGMLCGIVALVVELIYSTK